MQSKDIVEGQAYLVKFAGEERRGVVTVAPSASHGIMVQLDGTHGNSRPMSVRPQAVLRPYTLADEAAKREQDIKVERAKKVAELLSALLGIEVSTTQYSKDKAKISLPHTLDLETAEAMLHRFGMQVPQS